MSTLQFVVTSLLPGEETVLIRGSLLALCDGDVCAAALLEHFRVWDAFRSEGLKLRPLYVENSALSVSREFALEGWVAKSDQALAESLFRMYSVARISRGVRLIQAKGFIEVRPHPISRVRRMMQYRFNEQRLEEALADLKNRTVA